VYSPILNPIAYFSSLFKEYKIHQRVNIETDLFARYLYNMLKRENKNFDEILAWW
jgi:riboflavin synthase